MAVVAIRCLPLLNHVTNSTDRQIGARVSVTCRQTQTWSDQQINSMVAVCDHIGRWQPAIPDCVSK